MSGNPSGNQPKPAMDLILEVLRRNPKATYAEVRAAADERGLRVFPIMYGRAQALLGIVEVAPRGSRKVRAAGVAPEGGAAASFDSGALEGVLNGVRQAERQRQRYREALEKVRDLLRETLG